MAIIIPNNAVKTRKTNSRSVVGTIPNNGIDLNKTIDTRSAIVAGNLINNIAPLLNVIYGVEAGIDTTKEEAVALAPTSNVFFVTVVPADGGSVSLPPVGEEGTFVIVSNKNNEDDVHVYSDGEDNLNGSDTVAYVVTTGTYAVFVVYDGEWVTL